MQPPEQLVINSEVGADCQVLGLSGELDMATAPELERAISEMCADGAWKVTLDLAGLSFVDSFGLRVLLWARGECERQGCDFQMTHGQEPVERLFQLVGLDQRLPFTQAPPSASLDDDETAMA